MTPSKVPTSQIGRLLHYGGLAAGIGFGVLSGSLLRPSNPSSSTNSLIFSAANMERLVRKLSRMRGAALKLGQMISIQGIHFITIKFMRLLRFKFIAEADS
jgi:aarF domain-containing kinase